jgi:hypothetical protein
VLEDPGELEAGREDVAQAASVIPVTAKVRTREDVMREFWGDRWPEISAILKEKGRGDFATMPAEDLPPWDSVVSDVCQGMRMADSMKKFWMYSYMAASPMTQEYIQQNLGISDIELRADQLLEIDAILEESTQRGLAAFANIEYAVNIELANKCARGDYYYGPYTTAVAVPRRPDPAIFVYAYNVKGWNIKCTVWQDEVPHVEKDMEVLKGMKKIQRPLIYKYLASIRKK